jgi:hypothetical protein
MRPLFPASSPFNTGSAKKELWFGIDHRLHRRWRLPIASFDCQRAWAPRLAEPPNLPNMLPSGSLRKIKNPASSAGRIRPTGRTCSLLDRSFYPVFVTNLTSNGSLETGTSRHCTPYKPRDRRSVYRKSFIRQGPVTILPRSFSTGCEKRTSVEDRRVVQPGSTGASHLRLLYGRGIPPLESAA